MNERSMINVPLDENKIVKLDPKLQLTSNNSKYQYLCDKCGSTEYKLGETRSVSGLLSKIFNIQTRRFCTTTCTRCGFTEFYERYQNPLSNVIDILIR